MMKRLFIISCFLAILMSCTNASEDDLIDAQPLPDKVTYTAHVKPIIDNNCISCHKNPPVNGATIPLLTYQDVKTAVISKNLISKINGNGSGSQMPLGGPKLPQNSINLIEKWQTDGLLEN